MRSLVFSMRLTTRRLIGMTAFSWSSAAMVPSSQTESVSGLTSHKRYACGAYIHLSGNYRMTSERKAPYEKDPFTSQLRTRRTRRTFFNLRSRLALHDLAGRHLSYSNSVYGYCWSEPGRTICDLAARFANDRRRQR